MAGWTTTHLRCLCVTLAGVLCLGAGAPSGPVAGSNVALSYEHPPGCAGEATLRERVEDMYDFHHPFVPDGPQASYLLRVVIQHLGTGYRARVLLLDRDGRPLGQTVELHENCDALVYDVAHRVRLMLPAAPTQPARDPEEEKKLLRRIDRLEEATEALKQKNEALEQKDKAREAAIARLAKDLEEEKRKMNLSFTLATGVLMTANLTSDVGPGVWVSGGLWSGPLGVSLDLRAVLPARVAVGPYDRDVSQLVGLLTPCGRYSVFFGCAVGGAGVQIAHDSDYPNLAPGQSPTAFAPLLQLGGRVGVEVPLGESRLAIRGWAEVLYSTPNFNLIYAEGYSATLPEVSAYFGLGLVVKLGKEQEGAK